jgi:transcriptional regulator GlxA family with amidase domain
LKIANRLVMDSGLAMREIAVRSGFNSLSAFSRAYAVRFGSPPSSTRSSRM